jgi:hypothetical protein
MPRVRYVAVDFHLNENGAKFQPDLAALTEIEPLQLLLFLDYESPNSCDNRIRTKDVAAYEKWRTVCTKRIPYFIVTTLPNQEASDWELRYTSKNRCNEGFRGRREDIRKNPFVFWYSEYRRRLRNVPDVYFINIDGKHVAPVPV